MNNYKTVIIAVTVASLVIGFFIGQEVTKYRIQQAFVNAMTHSFSSPSPSPVITKEKTIIFKLGEEATFSTMKMKVQKSEEKNILQSSYSNPKVAKQGTKFVIVTLDATNTTNAPISFTPTSLMDEKNRIYNEIPDVFIIADNHLSSRNLAPGITETGVEVYEVPEDSSNYSIVSIKESTNELFKLQAK